MLSSGTVVPKYDRLVTLGQHFNVPRLLLIDERRLRSLISNFAEILAEADKIVARIAQTMGTFIAEDTAKLAAVLSRLQRSTDAEAELEAVMAPVFGPDWKTASFAVRSAAIAEDLDDHSFAGLYATELNVCGTEEIFTAITNVWVSGFDRGPVLERLSDGLLKSGNPICVIVQEMVDADFAGVAFSIDPVSKRADCVIEAVKGIGEALVSGKEEGRRYVFGEGTAPAAGQARFRPVADLCRAVESQLGCPVDIEWALAGDKVHLLQARRITTLGNGGNHDTGPVLETIDLYGDDEAGIAAFGPLPEFARYFRNKRKRIHDFGIRHGLSASTALLVRANRLGLENVVAASRLAGTFKRSEVIVDLSEQIRQVIVPSASLLDELISLMPDPTRVHVFVLRDFVRGDVGMISEPGEASVVLEWSADGLLAMNRGTAKTATVRLGEQENGHSGLLPPVDPSQVIKLRDVTSAAQSKLGPIRIEWVAGRDGLFALDFSEIGDAIQLPDGDVIAHGYAEAPVLALDADDALYALSIAPSMSLTSIPDANKLGDAFGDILRRVQSFDDPPIIVIDRPYAVLAALLPYVSGFVFEHASTLCHLSILIREHGLPGLQSPAAYEKACSAAVLRLDTRGSGITAIQGRRQLADAAGPSV